MAPFASSPEVSRILHRVEPQSARKTGCSYTGGFSTIRFVPNTGVHTSAEEELLFSTNPLIMTDEIYKDSNCLTIIA